MTGTVINTLQIFIQNVLRKYITVDMGWMWFVSKLQDRGLASTVGVWDVTGILKDGPSGRSLGAALGRESQYPRLSSLE